MAIRSTDVGCDTWLDLYRGRIKLRRKDAEALCITACQSLHQVAASPDLTSYEQDQVRRAHLMACEALATLKQVARVSPGR